MKKETLKEQQDKLDLEKYQRSVLTSCDQSGMMWYCKGCQYCKGEYLCAVTHEQRLKGSLCAKNARKIGREAK